MSSGTQAGMSVSVSSTRSSFPPGAERTRRVERSLLKMLFVIRAGQLDALRSDPNVLELDPDRRPPVGLVDERLRQRLQPPVGDAQAQSLHDGPYRVLGGLRARGRYRSR